MGIDSKKLLFLLLIPLLLLSDSYVNDNGQLMVNDKPFFIMGMFADQYGASYNSKMATVDSFIIAGFNTIKTQVMGEAWQTNAILNYANINDIKLIYDGAKNNEWKDFHINAMKANRYHPGLLGWYIVDDSHGVHPDTIRMYHEQAKTIDPNHITTHSMALSCWNNYGADHIQERIEYCDLLQMQSYPIGKEPIDEVYRDMRTTIEAAEPYKKPVVIDLQLFNWELNGHDWGRWPTEKEVELMTWLAIVAGVDGYLYYTYNDNLKPPAKPLSQTQPQLWKTAKETAQKVNYLKSGFLNYDRFYSKNPLPNQYFGQWIHNNNSLIIAINTSQDDSLYFNIPLVNEHVKVSDVFSDSPGTINKVGRFLKGKMPPMSVQFYKTESIATGLFDEVKNTKDHPRIFPNPFNNSTTIEFLTNKSENIQIVIYSLAGYRVKSTTVKNFKGRYQLIWEGIDDNNNPVPSGIYICKIQFGDRIFNEKLILIK